VVRDRPAVAGALLVGGASTRFGSPKALAYYEGETLAERAHRVLAEAFDEVIVVGKAADELALPFDVVDDGSDVRAAMVGVAAALRLAEAEVVVALPTDMPLVTAELLEGLAAASEGAEVTVPQTGPLPGAYRRTVLPVLERRIAAGDLALHRALRELRVRVIECDSALLMNINTRTQIQEEGRRKRP
jgi:molybdopterin-guanine dinucleotide biosynthesis protein A